MSHIRHSQPYCRPRSYRSLSNGSLSEEHFNILIKIARISSRNNIAALKDYLVSGKKRKDACNANNTSLSYFSVKLRQLQSISDDIITLYPFYAEYSQSNSVTANSAA
ncbi:MAG: PapB/FocB family fimbrial expression transcriptional regulator [Acinetobacter sp.]